MYSGQVVFPLVFVLLAASGIQGQSLPVASQPIQSSASLAQQPSEVPQHRLSKRDLKVRIANAKTAQDHEAIADYFAKQALLFERKANEYEERTKLIAEHPSSYKTKYPSAYDDSRFWQQYYEEQSGKARSEAELHRQLATTLGGGKK